MKIRKLFFSIVIVVFLGLFVTGQTMAGQLDWKDKLNTGQCSGGDLVINITHKVINGLDSGVVDWWASVSYERTIQVWQVDENEFCAFIKCKGKFSTLEGLSPMDTNPGRIINAGTRGTFQGGYVMTIRGNLKDISRGRGYPRKGTIGTFDFRCEAIGFPDHVAACPGIFIWHEKYFEPGYVKKYKWWSCTYRTEKNGTWVNSSDGDMGDIK